MTERWETLHSYYGIAPIFKTGKLPFSYRLGKNHWMSQTILFCSLGFQLAKFRPQLVYTRDVYFAHAATTLGWPVIFESHAPLISSENGMFDIVFRRLLKSPKLKRFVVITDALREAYSELGYPDPSLMHVAPDAADMVDTTQTPDNWQGRPDALQVGYVGSLYQGRGVEIILELARLHPEMDFHMVGGRDEDITRWTKMNDVQNLILHGHQPHGTTQRYRNACQVLLAPYQQEIYTGAGLEIGRYLSPMKLFEYMASQKPIICSDIPVLREIINDNNAILVSPTSVEEWSQALVSLKDPQKRDNIATQAYRDFSDQYTWNKRAKTVIKGLS